MCGDWWTVKRTAEGVAHHAGITSCASPWACPVCAAKIAAGRVTEIAEAVTAARAAGYNIWFPTWTFSHHAGDELGQLLDAQQRAWRLVTKSRLWRRMRQDHHLEYVRTREQTFGTANGWHPHYHGLLFFVGDADRAQAEAELGAEWRRALTRVGLSGSVDHAFKLEAFDDTKAGDEATLAAYLTKQLALEVSGGIFKDGRYGRFTPFAILDAAMDGEVWAVDRWHEYEQATRGKRTIFWSQGMRRFRARPEQTDEQLAEAEVGGQIIFAADRATKQAIFRLSPRGIDVLELAEADPDSARLYVLANAPLGARILFNPDDYASAASAS